MRVTDEEAYKMRKFVADLNADGGLVVVEGKRDRDALRKIGVTAKIAIFHRFGGSNHFADAAAEHAKVIMLLDGDRKGRYLTAKAVERLQRRTRVDLSFKRRLVQITKGRIRFVEELAGYETFVK